MRTPNHEYVDVMVSKLTWYKKEEDIETEPNNNNIGK